MSASRKDRAGRSARAYQTHPVVRSFGPPHTGAADAGEQPGLSLPHAPALREATDSGVIAQAMRGKCRGRHTRKPRLLLRFSGAFLLRLAARQFVGLLYQEP